MLLEVNFEGATIIGVDFTNANLGHASLKNVAMWISVKFSGGTILPNGESWNPDVDMMQFIDPSHPEFFVPSPPRG